MPSTVQFHLRSIVFTAVIGITAGCSDSGSPAGSPVADAATDAGSPQDVTPPADAPSDAAVPSDARPADAPPADAQPADAGVTDAPPVDVTPADAATDGGAACTLTRALVGTSNYVTGAYALGPVATPASLAPVMAMAADQDHLPVQSGCLVFDLERQNDAVDVLDPAHLPTVLHHIPLRAAGVDGGMGYLSNPQDALTLSPTRVYVAQLAVARIAIVDPTRDGAAAVTGGVDLTPVVAASSHSATGSPSPVAFFRAGSRVYVALQNLDTAYAPSAAGTLAVIDTGTDTLVDTDSTTPGVQPITLSHRNPQSMAAAGDGRVVVSESGVVAFSPPQVLDGLIEAVDLTTGHPVTAQRVTETQLGGDVSGVVMFDTTHGWAVVSVLGTDGGVGDNRLVPFDLGAGTVGMPVLHTGSIAGIAKAPDGTVWVLDRTLGHTGVRVFRQDGTETTTSAVSTGMFPPYGLAFVP